MIEQLTKICKVCGRELPATPEFFTTHPTCKYGLNSKCRECISTYMKERRKRYGKEIDKKNLPYARKWKKEHAEEIKEYQTEWYKNNKKKIEEYSKNYYAEHREEIIEKATLWNKKHPEKAEKNRRKSQLSQYGLTIEEYDKLYDEQNGVCACCGEPQTLGCRFLSVDHDHETGRVRGLLCTNCNIGLGHFKDDKEKLKMAIKYLEENSGT